MYGYTGCIRVQKRQQGEQRERSKMACEQTYDVAGIFRKWDRAVYRGEEGISGRVDSTIGERKKKRFPTELNSFLVWLARQHEKAIEKISLKEKKRRNNQINGRVPPRTIQKEGYTRNCCSEKVNERKESLACLCMSEVKVK